MHKKRIVKPMILKVANGNRRGAGGQAMVEYVLIAFLVAVAMIAALTLAGPAIGNVFSNTVYNALGQTTTPYNTFWATNYNYYATAVASYTLATFPFTTNTPAAPTCANHPGVWMTSVNLTPPVYREGVGANACP